jgi:hypothetical protein
MRSAIQNDITPQSASLWMVGRAERLAVFQHRARRDDGATPRHWLDYRARFTSGRSDWGKSLLPLKGESFGESFLQCTSLQVARCVIGRDAAIRPQLEHKPT